MILYYTEKEEDLIFAISYLTLSIEAIISTKFVLKIQDKEFVGVENVLRELIELCKCDPHDLCLLNEEILREIIRIRNFSPSKILKTLLNKKSENKEENLPSNIPLNYYLKNNRLSMADLVLFARAYKARKENTHFSLLEVNWFNEFQSQLQQLMEFKELDMTDFECFDIRVGKIIKIEKHPELQKLFIEQVEIGNQNIQVVSGLAEKYSMNELLDKYFLFMINLKKIKFRGVVSQGMILCASSNNEIEVLKAPSNISGEKLYLTGEKKPVIRTFNVPKIQTKDSIFIDVMEKLKIRGNKLTFKEKAVLVDGKEIECSFENGNVS